MVRGGPPRVHSADFHRQIEPPPFPSSSLLLVISPHRVLQPPFHLPSRRLVSHYEFEVFTHSTAYHTEVTGLDKLKYGDFSVQQ